MKQSKSLYRSGMSVHGLVDSLVIPDRILNLLFIALLMTVLGVFIGANLLLLNSDVLSRSVMVTLICAEMVVLFYAAGGDLHMHLRSLKPLRKRHLCGRDRRGKSSIATRSAIDQVTLKIASK